MAGLDDAVLARRQKDLEGYSQQIQADLDKLARVKMAGMKTYWQALDYKLRFKTKQLYERLGALQDPKKIQTLKENIKQLEAYIQQIQTDLRIHEAGAQPFFTASLKNQLEASYYLNGYGLEQAAKVAATVPILTPTQILGALVNPWVGDKLNYSDRIRINTANLAAAMRRNIESAVNEGWGWNQTARAIQASTGESYFRAVALARSELNRASALGASYSYMQNEDILDGKRWNATLDSKTAAKDAANDTKIFDVDYDTPTNPGIPGKRIPNHTNCRCSWSPVLSALGVSTRERIARDKGGNRIYTKAGSYKEYAKEVGLPDLDERLEADNPKRYLRPGETVASLEKEVKRWTYKGKTITVPKPDWLEPPEVIPPIVQQPTAVKSLRKTLEETVPPEVFNDVGKDVGEAFYASMEKAPEDYRNFFQKYYKNGITKIVKTKGGSCYSAGTVKFDPEVTNGVSDPVGKPTAYRRAIHTILHEFGHGLDYSVPKTEGLGYSFDTISQKNQAYKDAIDKYIAEFKQTKSTAYNTGWQRVTKDPKKIAVKQAEMETAKAIIKDMQSGFDDKYKYLKYDNGKFISQPQYSGLSNIFDGITLKSVTGGCGHDLSYWNDSPGRQHKETFANLFELYVHHETEAIGYVKKFFPDIIKAFEDIIKLYGK